MLSSPKSKVLGLRPVAFKSTEPEMVSPLDNTTVKEFAACFSILETSEDTLIETPFSSKLRRTILAASG
jgi:hypothetical protein